MSSAARGRPARGTPTRGRGDARNTTNTHFSPSNARTGRGAFRGLPTSRGHSVSYAGSARSKHEQTPGTFGAGIDQSSHQMLRKSGLSKARQATGDWQERYMTLETNRKRERADAIRNGIIADPDKPRKLAEAITPIGTCQDMCAEFERVERVVQKDVWMEETDPTNLDREPDESRMIKKFRRAAAGIEEQLPSDLRPPTTLKRTCDYLFNDIVGQAKSLQSVHHFVWDRTRAIRNDFSIQQISKPEDLSIAIECYERIARFHLLSLHQLALPTKPYDKYDWQQEREQLDRTLLSLMQYYEDSRGKIALTNEAEFRAYCVIFQLQDPVPDLEDRVQSWPREIALHPRVQRALQLYAAASTTNDMQGPLKPPVAHAIAQQDWHKFWRLVESNGVSYLMACVAEIYFNHVRRTVLQALLRSTSSKHMLQWSIEDVRQMLAFDDYEEVEDFCERYSLAFKEVNGQTLLDLSVLKSKQLPDAKATATKQTKSQLVEQKRCQRTFPAIIRGLSVREAQQQGLIEEEDEDEMRDVEDSTHVVDNADIQDQSSDDGLFVSQDKKPPASSFGAPSVFSKPSISPFAAFAKPSAVSAASSSISPFASFSKPPATSAADFTSFGKPSAASSTSFGKPSATSFTNLGTPSAASFTNLGKPPGAPISSSVSFGKPSASPFAPSITTTPVAGLSTASQSNVPFSKLSTSVLGAQSIFASTSSDVTAGGLQASKTFDFAKPSSFAMKEPKSVASSPLSAITQKPAFDFLSMSSKTIDKTTQQQPSLFARLSNPPTFGGDSTTNSLFPTASSDSAISNGEQPPAVELLSRKTSDAVIEKHEVTHQNTLFVPSKEGSQDPGRNLRQHESNNATFDSPTTQQLQQPKEAAHTSFSLSKTAKASSDEQLAQKLSSLQQPLDTNPRSAFTTSSTKTIEALKPAVAPTPPQAPAEKNIPDTNAILDQVAAHLTLDDAGGYLRQYVDFTLSQIITAAQETIYFERINQEAQDYRNHKLSLQYGIYWRDICRRMRLARHGREQRERAFRRLHEKRREPSVTPSVTGSASSRSGTERRATQSMDKRKAVDKMFQRSLNTRWWSKEATNSEYNPQDEDIHSATSARAKSVSRINGQGRIVKPNQTSASSSSFRRSTQGSTTTPLRTTTKTNYFRRKALGLDIDIEETSIQSRKRGFSDLSAGSESQAISSLASTGKVSDIQEQTDHAVAKIQKTNTDDDVIFARLRAARESLAQANEFYQSEITKAQSPPSFAFGKTTYSSPSLDRARMDARQRWDVKNGIDVPAYRLRESKFVSRDSYSKAIDAARSIREGRSQNTSRPTSRLSNTSPASPVINGTDGEGLEHNDTLHSPSVCIQPTAEAVPSTTVDHLYTHPAASNNSTHTLSHPSAVSNAIESQDSHTVSSFGTFGTPSQSQARIHPPIGQDFTIRPSQIPASLYASFGSSIVEHNHDDQHATAQSETLQTLQPRIMATTQSTQDHQSFIDNSGLHTDGHLADDITSTQSVSEHDSDIGYAHTNPFARLLQQDNDDEEDEDEDSSQSKDDEQIEYANRADSEDMDSQESSSPSNNDEQIEYANGADFEDMDSEESSSPSNDDEQIEYANGADVEDMDSEGGSSPNNDDKQIEYADGADVEDMDSEEGYSDEDLDGDTEQDDGDEDEEVYDEDGEDDEDDGDDDEHNISYPSLSSAHHQPNRKMHSTAPPPNETLQAVGNNEDDAIELSD